LHEQIAPLPERRPSILLKPSVNKTAGIVHRSKIYPAMAALGHFRQIDPLPTLSACPLRSDRVRTFASQRIDALCHKPTYAVQQIAEQRLVRQVTVHNEHR
jgi:hypothetical protein